jgi:hypothetical protein
VLCGAVGTTDLPAAVAAIGAAAEPLAALVVAHAALAMRDARDRTCATVECSATGIVDLAALSRPAARSRPAAWPTIDAAAAFVVMYTAAKLVAGERRAAFPTVEWVATSIIIEVTALDAERPAGRWNALARSCCIAVTIRELGACAAIQRAATAVVMNPAVSGFALASLVA